MAFAGFPPQGPQGCPESSPIADPTEQTMMEAALLLIIALFTWDASHNRPLETGPRTSWPH